MEEQVVVDAPEQGMTQEDAALREEIAAQVFGEKEADAAIPAAMDADVKIVDTPKEEIQPADPWAGISPVLKTQFETMTAKLQELSGVSERLKQAEKRVGSLTNEIHAAKQAAKMVSEAPSMAEIQKASENLKKWNELKEEFPDWGDALDGKIAAERAEIIQNLKSSISDPAALREEIGGMTQKMREELKSEVNAEIVSIHTEILKDRHPDYVEIKNDPKFGAWWSANSAEVSKYNTAIGTQAAKVLDLYKESLKPVKTTRELNAERQKRLGQSEILTGRNLPHIKNEADMTDAELRAAIAARVFKRQKG